MATIDVDALQSFTSAELLKLAEYGIAQLLAGGQEYTLPGGKTFKRADLDKLKEIRNDLKSEVESASSSTGTNTALSTFGRQQ